MDRRGVHPPLLLKRSGARRIALRNTKGAERAIRNTAHLAYSGLERRRCGLWCSRFAFELPIMRKALWNLASAGLPGSDSHLMVPC
jgi:hypothetical protein